MIKTYSDVIKLPTFEDRFLYLMLHGEVCRETFAGHRWLNQQLYRSKEWKDFRRKIIVRDRGCDLAVPNMEIPGNIVIHHINPITIEDLRYMRPCIFDSENVICVSHSTHNSVHYGDMSFLDTIRDYVPRKPNDTLLWG